MSVVTRNEKNFVEWYSLGRKSKRKFLVGYGISMLRGNVVVTIDQVEVLHLKRWISFLDSENVRLPPPTNSAWPSTGTR